MPARSRPYFCVDVLDHLLAPLMLEIDVDVGRLLALLGNEPLEQQVAGRRVDRGDAERIADGAVRRAPAPLAEDRRAKAAGEGDDVVDGQEIAREVELLDQLQLVVELGQHLVRDAVAPALPSRPPRSDARDAAAACGPRAPLARIFIAQLVEAEMDGVGEFARRGNRVRPAGEQPRHLLRRLQMPLGIGVAAGSRPRRSSSSRGCRS